MNKQTQGTGKESKSLSDYAASSVDAAAEAAGEKVEQVTNRLASVMESSKEICNRVREKAVDYAKATHQAVQERPYHGIGIAFVAGALIGYLISRSRSSDD